VATVDYEVRGRIALITLDRPDARNAVNPAMAAGLEAAVDRFEANPDLWVAVLAGRGPVFCAGADLSAVVAGLGPDLFTERGGFAGLCQRERVKPIIAAVDGPALAGGCEMAMACDMVVASELAIFGLPDVKRSMVASGGGLFRLPRAVGAKIGLEMVLTGDPMGAERAYQVGLVNRLVQPGQAVEVALAMAERIAGNAPVAVQESRAVVLAATGSDEDVMWQATAHAATRVAHSEDFSEGPRAFVEGRRPRWQGR
jgi:enoyl-CoA hydratase